MEAAAFSPIHLATSHEMLMAFLGHYLGIDPLDFYQVIGHALAAFSLSFVFYWCTRRFGLSHCAAAVGAALGVEFLLLADKSLFGTVLGAASSLQSADPGGWVGFSTISGYMWQGKLIVWILFLRSLWHLVTGSSTEVTRVISCGSGYWASPAWVLAILPFTRSRR